MGKLSGLAFEALALIWWHVWHYLLKRRKIYRKHFSVKNKKRKCKPRFEHDSTFEQKFKVHLTPSSSPSEIHHELAMAKKSQQPTTSLSFSSWIAISCMLYWSLLSLLLSLPLSTSEIHVTWHLAEWIKQPVLAPPWFLIHFFSSTLFEFLFFKIWIKSHMLS